MNRIEWLVNTSCDKVLPLVTVYVVLDVVSPTWYINKTALPTLPDANCSQYAEVYNSLVILPGVATKMQILELTIMAGQIMLFYINVTVRNEIERVLLGHVHPVISLLACSGVMTYYVLYRDHFIRMQDPSLLNFCTDLPEFVKENMRLLADFGNRVAGQYIVIGILWTMIVVTIRRNDWLNV